MRLAIIMVAAFLAVSSLTLNIYYFAQAQQVRSTLVREMGEPVAADPLGMALIQRYVDLLLETKSRLEGEKTRLEQENGALASENHTLSAANVNLKVQVGELAEQVDLLHQEKGVLEGRLALANGNNEKLRNALEISRADYHVASNSYASLITAHQELVRQVEQAKQQEAQGQGLDFDTIFGIAACVLLGLC